MSHAPYSYGGHPPPVRGKDNYRGPKNRHAHEEHRIGHHAPRASLDIIQTPSQFTTTNTQTRQAYVGAAPRTIPKPRYENPHHQQMPSLNDAYFSRALGGSEVELRNNFNRYEVEPDIASVPSRASTSPGTGLPHEMAKSGSVSSDLTGSNGSIETSTTGGVPLGDPEREFEDRAKQRSANRASTKQRDSVESISSPGRKGRNSTDSTISKKGKGRKGRDSTDSVTSKKGRSSTRSSTRSSPRRRVNSVPLMTVKIKVPKGAKAGDTTEFRLPGGTRTAQIKIPKGARGGSVITVKVPKDGSVFSVANDVSSLTNGEVKKAEKAFRKLDVDKDGYLSENEVRLILMELGMDCSGHMVEEMINVFDQDGSGAIDVEDFKLLYANCPIGDIDWSHINEEALAKIEKHMKGDHHKHEGFSETSGFLRTLDKGMHFHRVDRNGNAYNVLMRLTPQRDGFHYQSGRQVAKFPFGALWAVAEPFTEESHDTFGLVPQEVASFTILLVFGVKAKPEFALLLSAGSGNPPGISPTETSMNAMEIGMKYATDNMFVEADVIPVEIGTPKKHASFVNSLTSMDTLTTNDEESQPHHRAVLLLVADSVDQRNKAFKGFKNLLYHHQHHILDKNAKNTKQATNKANRGKTAKHAGRFDRYLQQLHHLYRPHHHVNHPPARYHTGIEAEVAYDESYSMTLKITVGKGRSKVSKKKDVNLPSPVFRDNMYVVAKIKRYDRETGTYDLDYTSGPYLAEEDPDGTKLFVGPETADSFVFQLKGVKQSLITVDLYDNYGSHQPIFLLVISFIQCACFTYWVIVKEGGVASSYSPISGPEWSWLRIVGDMGGGCPSLRYDYWRFISYQFVHNGLVHIFSNMLMQLLFGLPLNMVHGSLRFGLIYELGVMFGALTFVTVDGGYDSVVGCSGGVYCIFGMHLAEIVTNWSLEHRGLMNHWMRLFIMAVVLGLDGYKIYTSPSATTSYSAHLGGIIAGYLCGIIFLDTLETTWFHRYIGGPFVWILVILLPLSMVYYYSTSDFPPPPLGAYFVEEAYENPPCCFQARACDRVNSGFYDAFVCQLGGLEDDTQRLFQMGTGRELDSCTDIETAVEEYYGLNSTYFL